uniref:Reverse transcriptase zinc-binding domain-containing protein n=1 Tax=Globisporangium ultimum (strain ATCC 200006 / CBS 805.95 / DAOM BR144) TaxID=431595 RepID=K3WHA6_GLOUD
MTRYQVWFNYRMSAGQLNLYYQGRELDNTCKADPSCKDLKETIAHIAWECSHAQAIWQQVWTHWEGENHYDQRNVRQYVTSRQTPPPSQQLIQRVQSMYGFFTDDHAKALDSIWWIVTSVVTSLLWLRRNERVFWHQHSTTSECYANAKQLYWYVEASPS